MEYLYYAGDDRFGALGVSTSPSTYSPRTAGPLPRLEDAQRLSEVAAKIEAAEPLTTLEAQFIAGGGSPLGGAKPKALIEIDGQQWVIKFFNNEPVDTPLIEHATMTLAERAGITVAQTQFIHLAGTNAVAIRRFDREQGRRIHRISAGTAIRAAHLRDMREGRRIGARHRESGRAHRRHRVAEPARGLRPRQVSFRAGETKGAQSFSAHLKSAWRCEINR